MHDEHERVARKARPECVHADLLNVRQGKTDLPKPISIGDDMILQFLHLAAGAFAAPAIARRALEHDPDKACPELALPFSDLAQRTDEKTERQRVRHRR